MKSEQRARTSGQPLGVLTQAFVERPLDAPAHTPSELRKLPIEDKESCRWLEAFEQTIALTPAGVQVVTVCDREADIYEMFVMAAERQAALLVRADQDRGLQDAEGQHLWAQVAQQPVQGTLDVRITGNDQRKERQATVSIRYCTVRLRPPWRPKQKKLPAVKLQAILVREEHPPENLAELGDHEPIEWLLLTNTAPDLPCTHILTTVEWQALDLRMYKTSAFPKTLPTVRQAVRWIAQLGGFLGRKSDGEPGITAIWRGWQRLQDLAATWQVVVNEHAQRGGNR